MQAVAALALIASLGLVRSSRIQADETLPFIIQDSVYRTNLAIINLDADPAQVAMFLYDIPATSPRKMLSRFPG